MNDIDLCLEVVSRSCQPLRYIRRWISRKPLQIEAWFQRPINKKWHKGFQMVQRCCHAVRSAILATAWLLVFCVGNNAVQYRSNVMWCWIWSTLLLVTVECRETEMTSQWVGAVIDRCVGGLFVKRRQYVRHVDWQPAVYCSAVHHQSVVRQDGCWRYEHVAWIPLKQYVASVLFTDQWFFVNLLSLTD